MIVLEVTGTSWPCTPMLNVRVDTATSYFFLNLSSAFKERNDFSRNAVMLTFAGLIDSATQIGGM